METLATPHIRCLNLVPCKFEAQFNSCRAIVMRCCPADSSLQEFSLWFLLWFLGWTEAPESASGFDQQCIMQASRTRRALRDIPKALSLQSAWVLSIKCVSLMALRTLGHFRRGRVLPRGVCHHVIVVFLLVFFSYPSIFPILVCGRVWLMALWQRWSIIHHQGGWHEYALWDKFLSATRHKLDSCSFRSIISINLSATILLSNTLAKHLRPIEWFGTW